MESTKYKVLESAILLTHQACFCMMTPDEPSSVIFVPLDDSIAFYEPLVNYIVEIL